jgi:hypothetical protein
MITMFQYKGNAYVFDCVDESLLDITETVKKIEAGECPAMPMSPAELTAYLRDRKKNPNKKAD